MSGKRGRSTPESKAQKRFSSESFKKYYDNQGTHKMRKATREELVDSNINKKWIKDNLEQNKQYEKVNKLGGKKQNWDDVYSEANRSGISTKKLEDVARKSKSSYDMNEYGFKPHVQNVVSQYQKLKAEGLMPGATLKGFNTTLASNSIYGGYRPSTGEYVINLNSLGVGRINFNMSKGGLAGKSFKDVSIHELGHSVYFQNTVKGKSMRINGKKRRAKFSSEEKAIRSAYATLHKNLRKTSKITGQSSYVDKLFKSRTNSKLTKEQRGLARRKTNVEAFAEGYTNYVNYRRGGTSLTPSGRAVGNFLREISKYRK